MPETGRMSRRPDDEDLCAFCAHRFGDHATSYDKRTHGCLGSSRVEYETPCTCERFTMVWLPED
jgi:hypothetical protein